MSSGYIREQSVDIISSQDKSDRKTGKQDIYRYFTFGQITVVYLISNLNQKFVLFSDEHESKRVKPVISFGPTSIRDNIYSDTELYVKNKNGTRQPTGKEF